MVQDERRGHRPRKTADEAAEAEPSSTIGELEDVYDDMREHFLGMFSLPEEFNVHVRAARKEMLLAVRSLIDARIASLEESERRRDAGRRARVQID